jgi:hypothetical protein
MGSIPHNAVLFPAAKGSHGTTLLDLLHRLDEGVRVVPILVAVQEQLRPNHSLLIDQHGAWIRNACLHALGFFIEQVKITDGLAAGVGKKRIGDLAGLAELGEDVDGIVTDGNDLDTGGFNLFQVRLQLN